MKGHMQDGKFHPHTDYKKGVRKSRDQKAKTQGVHIQSQTIFPNFANDVAEKISTRFGRGTISTGFFNVINTYNEEHPENQIDYSDSGLEGLDKTIVEMDDEEIYHDSLEKWNEWIERPENKPIKEIIKKMQVEVDDYNKLTDEKYDKLNKFYRGTSIDEINKFTGGGGERGGEIGSIYDEGFDFVSLTMSPAQAKVTFNQGIVIEYDADYMRNSGDANKVQYTMDFTPVVDIDPDSNLDSGDLEKIDSKQNALFVDEQEIRVRKDLPIEPKDIKRIIFYPEKIGYERLVQWIENDKLTKDFQNRTVDEWRWTLENADSVRRGLRNMLGDFNLVDIEVSRI